MSDSSGAPNAGEALVLVGYASLMESVQRFEWSLKRLAVQEDENLDSFSFDEAWKRAEKILRSSMGALEGKMPSGLIDDLSRLRRVRNQLAHEVLMRWRFETNLELATHEEVVDAFVELSNEFDSYCSQVDEIADKRLSELDIDPSRLGFSDSDLKKILSSTPEGER